MKTVLITGISKGIGKALAEKFLREGFDVIGTVYSGSFPEKSERLTTFKLDLSSPRSIARCAKKIAATGKKIDILMNNVGVLLDEEDTSVIVEKLRKTLEVNLIGTIDFTERIIPLMNRGGHIVNASSETGSIERTGHHTPVAGLSPYHHPCYKISKAAINMYTRTLALRLAKQDIIVSSEHPGWVKTDMGGPEADIAPEEAAESIYKLAVSRPESGQFWFNGEKLPW